MVNHAKELLRGKHLQTGAYELVHEAVLSGNQNLKKAISNALLIRIDDRESPVVRQVKCSSCKRKKPISSFDSWSYPETGHSLIHIICGDCCNMMRKEYKKKCQPVRKDRISKNKANRNYKKRNKNNLEYKSKELDRRKKRYAKKKKDKSWMDRRRMIARQCAARYRKKMKGNEAFRQKNIDYCKQYYANKKPQPEN